MCDRGVKPQSGVDYTPCHFLLLSLYLFLNVFIASGDVQRKRTHPGRAAEIFLGSANMPSRDLIDKEDIQCSLSLIQ